MLKPIAFATSLAILTALFFLIVHAIRLLAPISFRFIFNAQFLGADVASLMAPDLLASTYILEFIVAVVSAWVFAYAWAWLYNRLAGVNAR